LAGRASQGKVTLQSLQSSSLKSKRINYQDIDPLDTLPSDDYLANRKHLEFAGGVFKWIRNSKNWRNGPLFGKYPVCVTKWIVCGRIFLDLDGEPYVL
jgi:hypothetical protein